MSQPIEKIDKNFQSKQSDSDMVWHDAFGLTLEGKAFADTAGVSDRLPAAAEKTVPPNVWHLSHCSSGMAIRFVTDATQIAARWSLVNENLAMDHMAATGVSGLDLYVRHPQHGTWHWTGIGRPTRIDNDVIILTGNIQATFEYLLYLPLYNGVKKLELGIPQGATIRPATPREPKPIVFYGTSITMGGCASRPGMAYPAIIGRRLDCPHVNLGFSGNGRMESEVVDCVAMIDASVFVLDCQNNMTEALVSQRLEPGIRKLRDKHPTTPIVLVQQAQSQRARFTYDPDPTSPWSIEKNRIMAGVYEKLIGEGMNDLHMVDCVGLTGDDGEATVDGAHATDIGFVRMADKIGGTLEKTVR